MSNWNDKLSSLICEQGLYSNIDIEESDKAAVEQLYTRSDTKLDIFCKHCQKDSIFVVTEPPVSKIVGTTSVRMSRGDIFSFSNLVHKYPFSILELHCNRNQNHVYMFSLMLTNDKLSKVGQYPSIADISNPQLKRFRSVLGEAYTELSKALGLYSHGVGIGSFVYLRRIFENIIFDTFTENLTKLNISEQEFIRLRMEDKVKSLQDYLPPFLVSNSKIYGILSKGVHELSEEECIMYFDPIEKSIEMILDRILEQRNIRKKEEEIHKAIQSIQL